MLVLLNVFSACKIHNRINQYYTGRLILLECSIEAVADRYYRVFFENIHDDVDCKSKFWVRFVVGQGLAERKNISEINGDTIGFLLQFNVRFEAMVEQGARFSSTRIKPSITRPTIIYE